MGNVWSDAETTVVCKSLVGDAAKKVEVECIAISGTNVSAHVTLIGWVETVGQSCTELQSFPRSRTFCKQNLKKEHSPCKIPFGFLLSTSNSWGRGGLVLIIYMKLSMISMSMDLYWDP